MNHVATVDDDDANGGLTSQAPLLLPTSALIHYGSTAAATASPPSTLGESPDAPGPARTRQMASAWAHAATASAAAAATTAATTNKARTGAKYHQISLGTSVPPDHELQTVKSVSYTQAGAELSLPPQEDDGAVATRVLVGHTTEDIYHFFPVKTADLQDLVDPKSLKKLQELGGIERIADDLRSNLKRGLTTTTENDTIEVDGETKQEVFGKRRQQYGRNYIPSTKTRSFLSRVWEALQDRTLIILIIAAIVSIAIGIYDEVQQQKETSNASNGGTAAPYQPGQWVEGVAIILAVIIVVLINSINDYNKDKQFRKLNQKKEERDIKVIRDGIQGQISIHDLVVGDVTLVEYGDILCADGLFIEGHDVRCDESSMTGESDSVKKGTDTDPFMISGTKVLEGSGRMLVIAVGPNSFNGKVMLAMRTESEDTSLQVKLEDLADNIGKGGLSAAILLLILLIIIYCARTGTSEQGWPPGSVIAENIINFFIVAVTIVVVAVPEGLPMAVALALSFATIKMLEQKNLVRVLAACETMGGATSICSDKTGTLTQNRMTVVKGMVARISFEDAIGASVLNLKVSEHARDLIIEGLAVNSTAYEGKDDKGVTVFTGSKTEVALLTFVKQIQGSMGYFGTDYLQIREESTVESSVPFSSERKRMSTTVKSSRTNSSVLYCKGASEIILDLCTAYMDEQGNVHPLDEAIRAELDKRILEYASGALRTISFAYKATSNSGAGTGSSQSAEISEKDLIFLGLVGIQDPVRPEVPDAVHLCQHAGIRVRMVTGDNIITARNIAKQCGILTKGGIVMEGPEFRRLSPEQMERVVPNLEVLARSSPKDKQLFVQKLRDRGETVAVTGDGTNDGPALKLADVGFAMGIAGTEVAKEASDIILMDDNFASIVNAVLWGRCVYDSVRKFLTFQLTVNIAAVVLAFISAVSDTQNQSVLTAIQLLWINLIMDTMAALALASQPPSLELLDRKPYGKSDPLINFTMWKMIAGGAVFQVGVNLFLLYYGPTLFGLDMSNTHDRDINRTIVFNTFVFMQVFNEINCRNVTRDLNVFKDIEKNWIFLAIFFITVVVQFIIAQFGGIAFQTTGLNWWQWLVCIIVGFFSIPVGTIIRFIPDRPEKPKIDEDSHLTREKLLWESAIRNVRWQVRVVRVLRSGRRPI